MVSIGLSMISLVKDETMFRDITWTKTGNIATSCYEKSQRDLIIYIPPALYSNSRIVMEKVDIYQIHIFTMF